MTSAIDHFNGNQITRPLLNPMLEYDFDFRKKGSDQWRYINSTNDISKFSDQIKSVLEHNGEYRIIESETDKIIRQG